MTDPKPQADKFRDMARELEADEDDARFEEAARKVATAPVPPKAVLVKPMRAYPVEEVIPAAKPVREPAPPVAAPVEMAPKATLVPETEPVEPVQKALPVEDVPAVPVIPRAEPVQE